MSDEQFVPMLCQRCTAQRPAAIRYGDAVGWICWACYEAVRPKSKLDRIFDDRMARRDRA